MPFQIVRNDITKMQVDAIVNTANPQPTFGSGIDTAVYEAAGKEKLLSEREKIGVAEPGTSFVTDGYSLPAKAIIHTVGCPWQGGDQGEEEIIRSCYRSVFALAVEQEFESLAIPLLASGSYGFPKGIALRIALSEIEAFMMDHDLSLFLVVFDEKSFSLSSELYGDIDAYISDNYVEEKEKDEYPGSGRRDERTQRLMDNAFHGASAGMAAASMPMASMGMFAREQEKEDKKKDKKDKKKSRLFSTGIREAAPRFPGMGRKESPGDVYAAKETGSIPEEDLEDSYSEVTDEEDLAYGSSIFASAALAPEPRTLDEVIQNLDKSFMELVFSFADEKGMTDVQVQKRANLDRKAFSKLKCGTTKNPSKSTALALSVALQLSLDETKDLLSRAGLALSPCSRQDLIVQYFIEREAYDIFEINVALFEHGEPLLGSTPS